MSTPPPSRSALLFDAAFGFVAFFAFIAFVQAVLNLFQPEPTVGPALLALVLVVATVTMWRIRRRRNTQPHPAEDR